MKRAMLGLVLGLFLVGDALAQRHFGGGRFFAPGGGGAAGLGSNNDFSGDNEFTGQNLFLYNTTDSATPTAGSNSGSLIISAYDGLAGLGNNDADYPFQFWSYAITSHPMVWINAQGGMGTGAHFLVSNDFVGTLGVNQKAIGPFETSTGTDALGALTSWMGAIRGDIDSAVLQVGSTSSSGTGWAALGYNELSGTSSNVLANSRAYYGTSGQGGMAWSYSGVAPTNVHDGYGVGAATGKAKPLNDIMDFGMVPSGPNTLTLQLINQSSANSDSISKGFGYTLFENANGGYSGVGGLTLAAMANPAAPTVAKVGAHTAGATTCTYGIVAKNDVGQTLGSSTASATNCLATLDGSNSVLITWAAINGASSYDVYRTAGHSSTGNIATILASSSGSVQSGVGLSAVYFLSDDGISGGGETYPGSGVGRNTSAGVKLGSVTVSQISSNGNSAGMLFANGATVPISGTMSVNSTVVGNVGGGTDDLMSYTVPANTLGSAGRTLRITAWGSTANNANAKTLAHSFGGSATLSQSLTTSIAGRWEVVLVISRVSSGNQDWHYTLHESTATLSTTDKSAIAHGTTAITDSATIVSKFTAAATSDNDIVQEGMIVEVLN